MTHTKTHKLHRRSEFTIRNTSGRDWSGSATSAAKVSHRVGFDVRSNQVWIPGEGWVYWVEIERQVERAFRMFQTKQQRRHMHLMAV